MEDNNMSEFKEFPYLKLSNDAKSASLEKEYRYYFRDCTKKEYIDIPVGQKTRGIIVPICLRLFFPRWQYVKAVMVYSKMCNMVLNKTYTQKFADITFRNALLALGVSELKANIWYICLRLHQKFIKRSF